MAKSTDSWKIANGGKYKWGSMVYLRQGESPDHLLKRFSKKIQKQRILQDWRAKQDYKKPSEKRRTRLSLARLRARRANA